MVVAKIFSVDYVWAQTAEADSTFFRVFVAKFLGLAGDAFRMARVLHFTVYRRATTGELANEPQDSRL